jgi:hypothetical protein
MSAIGIFEDIPRTVYNVVYLFRALYISRLMSIGNILAALISRSESILYCLFITIQFIQLAS